MKWFSQSALQMFQKVNRLITYIPMLIVWEYLLLFFFRYSDWYKNNAKDIDNFDNILVAFCLVHFLAFTEIYNKIQIIYFFCIFLIVQLQMAYYFIPENIYYFLYLSILSAPIIRTFI